MKVGYAFVVADLIHIGHLKFFEKCKMYCNYLIVGVYTDELTQSYKRKPVIPFEERIQMVAALKQVDLVVKVEHRDQSIPMRKLHNSGYKLDFLFHGDDWDPNKDSDLKSSKAFIEEIGGCLIQPEYYEGQSSTKIIAEILDRYERGEDLGRGYRVDING